MGFASFALFGHAVAVCVLCFLQIHVEKWWMVWKMMGKSDVVKCGEDELLDFWWTDSLCPCEMRQHLAIGLGSFGNGFIGFIGQLSLKESFKILQGKCTPIQIVSYTHRCHVSSMILQIQWCAIGSKQEAKSKSKWCMIVIVSSSSRTYLDPKRRSLIKWVQTPSLVFVG